MSSLPEISVETVWAILKDEVADETANQLVWQALGYRWEHEAWNNAAVAVDWREAYPEPPNFIESRPATVMLTRSIPKPHKQLLKEQLGFQGYKIGELIPRKTRRATIANWLLSYLKQQDSSATSP